MCKPLDHQQNKGKCIEVISFQRDCGAASVVEYNKVIWYYQVS